MYKKISLSLVCLAMLTSCSSKKYYEPQNVDSISLKEESLKSDIVSFGSNFATLEDQTFITSKDGVVSTKIPEGQKLLNYENGNYLSADKNNNLYISSLDKTIKLDNNVIGATQKDNLVAILFSNNSIGIYDTNEAKFLFKDYLKESVANDHRITNPIFMTNIVLFPTLDGKVLVVSLENYNVVRNIVVDANSDKINNVIFFKVTNDRLVAATNNKIISVGTNFVSMKDYNIKDIIFTDNNFYISTVDGQIIKLDDSLNEVASKKYKYANFHTLLTDSENNIYAVESQGFLIKLDKDLTNDKVYEIDFDKEASTFSYKGTIINADNIYKLD